MPIEHLSADTTPEKVAEILGRDGGVVIDRRASPETMDRLEAEIRPFVDATPSGVDEFTGRNTKRTGALIARSPTSRELVLDDLVLGTAGLVLGHATSFQLHLTQIIAIGAGEPAQTIHRDQWAFDFFPFPQGFEVQCNTIWALTDFTERNGATRVIPGSNHHADKLQYKLEDTEPAEMEKGSVLLYTGALYHGGGANQSDATRVGVNITYNLSWLRQEENQYLSVPLEVARELPEKLQRLMGYARGAYALGYIDGGRDPMELLRPESASEGFGELSLAQARQRLRS